MVIKAYAPLSSRIAEEMQLLAEEKWLINTLTLVRKELNAMQIERLELESSKLLMQKIKRIISSPKPTTTAPTQSEPVEGSAVEIMISSQAGATLSELEKALPQDLVDNTFCNDQQLNLTVTNSIFNLGTNQMVVEEEESDVSDEEESPDSIFIDINMLMDSEKSW